MEYRNMGRTGLKVSEICLGTMTFGRYTDEMEARRMVDRCIGAGVNFYDTADGYGDGESEAILGNVLKGRRDQTVIASKFFNPMGTGPNDSGWSRAYLMRAVESSLRRLKTDYIDIYYIHHIDIQTPLEEVLRGLDNLVSQGKVRYIACSNFEAWRLMEGLWVSDSRNWSRIECYQPQYSLVVRDIEDELIPLCLYKGVGVVVWSPLAGGFLTGKYDLERPRILEGTRSADEWCFPERYFSRQAKKTLRALSEVSSATGKSAAQVALRWVVQQPGITSAIVGARNCEQLEDNLLAGSWQLDAPLHRKLTEVSASSVRYPKSMEQGMVDRRRSAVKIPGSVPNC